MKSRKKKLISTLLALVLFLVAAVIGVFLFQKSFIPKIRVNAEEVNKCYQFSSSIQSDACALSLAAQTPSAVLCDMVRDADNRDQCFAHIDSYIEKYLNNCLDTQGWRDACVKDTAIEKKRVDLCAVIVDARERNSCSESVTQ